MMGNSNDHPINDSEIDIVYHCLIAAVDGPFFAHERFHTLTGVNPEFVRAMLADWPAVDWTNLEIRDVIHNVILNLLHYPHGLTDTLQQSIPVTRTELEAFFERWKQVSDGERENGT